MAVTTARASTFPFPSHFKSLVARCSLFSTERISFLLPSPALASTLHSSSPCRPFPMYPVRPPSCTANFSSHVRSGSSRCCSQPRPSSSASASSTASSPVGSFSPWPSESFSGSSFRALRSFSRRSSLFRFPYLSVRPLVSLQCSYSSLTFLTYSYRTDRHDVAHPLPSLALLSPQALLSTSTAQAFALLPHRQLDHRTFNHARARVGFPPG